MSTMSKPRRKTVKVNVWGVVYSVPLLRSRPKRSRSASKHSNLLSLSRRMGAEKATWHHPTSMRFASAVLSKETAPAGVSYYFNCTMSRKKVTLYWLLADVEAICAACMLALSETE